MPFAGAVFVGSAVIVVIVSNRTQDTQRRSLLRLCGLCLCFYWHRRRSRLLLFPVTDCGADRIFRQDRAMDLDRRKRKLLYDLGVLDRQSLVNGLALNPLGGERRRRDGRSAAER